MIERCQVARKQGTISRVIESIRLPSVLIVAACLTASAPSFAQQPSPSTSAVSAAAAVEKADELYRQGNEAYKQNRLKDAYGFYRDAWNLKKSYDIAGNLGAVELAINLPRDAAEHLIHSLRQFPANGKPEARNKTKQWLEDALKQIGTLVVKVNVEGADILVDGKNVGKSPLSDEIFVDAGARRVEAKLEGYDSTRQEVQIAKGSSKEVTLKLMKSAAPPPLTAAGARPSRSIPIIVAGAALSAVGIGTGIGLFVAAGDKGTEGDTLLAALKQEGPIPCPSPDPMTLGQCKELVDLRRAHDNFHNAAIVPLVLGVLVGGATVAYTVLAGAKPKQSDSAYIRAVPVATTEGGGVWLTGAF
jgi:hypothetical protein